MFDKIIILSIVPDTENGGAKSVTIGFFDSKGVLQLEMPSVAGKLFPKDIIKGKEVIFSRPLAAINLIKK